MVIIGEWLHYILWLPVVVGTWCITHRGHYERFTVFALFGALALCYMQLYHTRYDQVTPDAGSNACYIRYLVQYHSMPTTDDCSTAVHPPTYYLLAASFYKAAQWLGAPAPLEVARHVSLLCYVAFLLINIALLRSWLAPHTLAYRSAVLVLLFWPLGVVISGRLSCDVLLYATQAWALYNISQWLRVKNLRSLQYAFIGAGCAVLTKNGGFITLALVGIVMIAELVCSHGPRRLSVGRTLFPAIVFAALCLLLVAFRHWTYGPVIEPDTEDWQRWRSIITSFDPLLLLYDVDMGLSQQKFWNLWLHSLLLGDGSIHWASYCFAMMVNITGCLLLFFIMVNGVACISRFSMPLKQFLLCYGLHSAALITATMLLLLRTGNVAVSDARYAYSLVPLLALLHGGALSWQERIGNRALVRSGILVASAFIICSFLLFFMQNTL